MADNTILPLGPEDGDTYASDDIGGVKIQRVKLVLGADGVNDGDASSSNPVPVSAAALPLPSGAATETTLADVLTTSDFDTKTGALTETAPGSDTASSGLNGRLQRIAQRITSLITALGSPFQAGGSIGNTTFDSTQSGTWTVQPGNTANTTAWKVDGSAVTQPVSAASLPLPALAATSTKQSDGSHKTQVVDGSGNVISSTGNAIDVNLKSANSTVSPLPVTEDNGAALNPVGYQMMVRRRDTLTASEVNSDDDYIAVNATAKGELYVKQTDALPAGTNAIGKLASNTGVTIGAVEIAATQTLATVTTVSTVTAVTQASTNEKPDATSTYAPDNAFTTAYATNKVIKGSAGVLFSVTGYNSRTSSQFIQLHNATSLPSDTAVPEVIFLVPASSNFSLDFGGKFGRYFSTGIVVCNSSTGPTKTIGAADCWFDAQYK